MKIYVVWPGLWPFRSPVTGSIFLPLLYGVSFHCLWNGSDGVLLRMLSKLCEASSLCFVSAAARWRFQIF